MVKQKPISSSSFNLCTKLLTKAKIGALLVGAAGLRPVKGPVRGSEQVDGAVRALLVHLQAVAHARIDQAVRNVLQGVGRQGRIVDDERRRQRKGIGQTGLRQRHFRALVENRRVEAGVTVGWLRVVDAVGLCALNSCKKNDPAPPPTPATIVAGQYTLTSYYDGTQTIALPHMGNGFTLSGTASVTAVSGQAAQVDEVVTLKSTGQPDQVNSFTGVQLQATTAGYNMLDHGRTLGTTDGTTLTFIDGAETITAHK